MPYTQTITKEVWKVPPTYPSFIEVSNKGRVREKQRKNATQPPVYLSSYNKHESKTPIVSIPDKHSNRSGKALSVPVRDLVADAFLGEKAHRHATLTHIDGDETNCESTNLRWAVKAGRTEALEKEVAHLKQVIDEQEKTYDILFNKYLMVLSAGIDGALEPVNPSDVAALLFNAERYADIRYRKPDSTDILAFPEDPQERYALALAKDNYDWYLVQHDEKKPSKPVEQPKTNKPETATKPVIRLGDLSAFLVCKRYKEQLGTKEMNKKYGMTLNVYENDQTPSNIMVTRLEHTFNISLNMKATTPSITVDRNDFSRRLNDTMQKRNLSIDDMVKLTDVKRINLRDYTERGVLPYKNKPTLSRIAHALKVSECWLLTGHTDWDDII